MAVLERDRIIERDTAHTTAHLTMVTDAWLSELSNRFGRDHARAAWDAGLAAIAEIDSIVSDEHIACDFAFVPGYLHQPRDGTEKETRRHFGTKRHSSPDLGFDATFVDDVPFVGGPGVQFDGSGADSIPANISPEWPVRSRPLADRSSNGARREDLLGRSGFRESERQHRSTAAKSCWRRTRRCSGSPACRARRCFKPSWRFIPRYVVGGRVRKGQVPDALFWDTADPYHYLGSRRRRMATS